MNLEMRDYAIRDIGCIAVRMFAGIKVPCEKHHLNSFDMPGGKRRGELYTIGLSPWSHRGICRCGLNPTEHQCPRCREVFGPSWRHHKREFIDTFGDGDAMLAYQNELIAKWRRGQLPW
jgi:hypothetical protein